jgi:hypothetical protein
MAFLDWIEAVPRWIKIPFAFAGFLLSAFSSRLPDYLQDFGLWLGLVVLVGAIIALFLHGIRDFFGWWSKKAEKPTPQEARASSTKDGLIDWDYRGIFGGSAGPSGHYIAKFWFHGVHHEKGLIQIERAAVTSLTTGKRLDLRLRTSSGYVRPSEANPIPPEANIYLDGLLYDPEKRKPGEREGITADEFIKNWGSFIFSVAYSINGQASEWSKKFDYEFVRNKLAEMNPLRAPIPSVTRR